MIEYEAITAFVQNFREDIISQLSWYAIEHENDGNVSLES